MKSFFFTLPLLFSFTVHSKIVDKVVAIVNTEIVTESDVEKQKRAFGGKALLNDLLLQIYDLKQIKSDNKKILSYLIDERIIDGEIKKNNLEVTIERVEQEISSVAKKNGMNRAQFKTALAKQGISISDYQQFVKAGLERQALVEKEVTSKIRISDEDIAAYYLANKGPGKTQVFEYSVSHIVFNPNKGGLNQAKSRADNVLKRLRSGANFEKTAEQFSEDPNFTAGGVLGTFNATELSPEVLKAVQGLEVNKYSDVVQTKQGLHIFKLTKKTLVADPQLTENREPIRALLQERAFKRQFRMWLDQQRAAAFIKINDVG